MTGACTAAHAGAFTRASSQRQTQGQQCVQPLERQGAAQERCVTRVTAGRCGPLPVHAGGEVEWHGRTMASARCDARVVTVHAWQDAEGCAGSALG